MGAAQGRMCGCDTRDSKKDRNACQPDLKKKQKTSDRRGPGFAKPQEAKEHFVGSAMESAERCKSKVSNVNSPQNRMVRPSSLHDRSALLLALMKPNDKTMNQRPHSPSQQEILTAKNDHQLVMAVRAISFSKQVPLPIGENLGRTFKDGHFQDELSKDFWQSVSLKLRSGDAASCFQRYRELHGRGVARFAAPTRDSWGSSHHILDDASHHKHSLASGDDETGRRHSSSL